MKSSIKASRPSPNRPVYLDPGVFVTPTGGSFELVVSRPDYADPISVVQRSGTHERSLPGDILNGWHGLRQFLRVRVTDSSGHLVKKRTMTFCPDSYDPQRVSPDGPEDPTFPGYCSAHPFTLASVWGIDDGWAVDPMESGIRFRGPNGHYTVQVSILAPYRDLLGIGSQDATATIGVTVVSDGSCGYGCGYGGYVDASESWSKVGSTRLVTQPGQDELPDLIPTPAWAIDEFHTRSGHDYLTFAATVWVGGASRLDVQGFRRPNSDVMDAYQYFYRNSTLEGRAPVGTLVYDPRRHHQHWHFTQFARYQLLDATNQVAVISHKEAFCIAPTDGIDLSLPDAVLRPAVFGFFGACGSAGSIWVRESMPVGWGDTYYQYIPGQSFNITDVPNGTYYVEVIANPGGHLYETDSTNDVSLRQVILGGTRGHRTVCVPAFDGLDPEGDCPPGAG